MRVSCPLPLCLFSRKSQIPLTFSSLFITRATGTLVIQRVCVCVCAVSVCDSAVSVPPVRISPDPISAIYPNLRNSWMSQFSTLQLPWSSWLWVERAMQRLVLACPHLQPSGPTARGTLHLAHGAWWISGARWMSLRHRVCGQSCQSTMWRTFHSWMPSRLSMQSRKTRGFVCPAALATDRNCPRLW